MGATLWDILSGKAKKAAPATVPTAATPPELKIYNPLDVKLGAGIRIKTIDLEDQDFRVTGIREDHHIIGERTFDQVHYDIAAKQADGNQIKMRLWLIAENNTDKDLKNSVVLLSPVADFGYDEEYFKGLAFENNNGEAQEGDDHFWRVNDVHEPWEASTTYIRSNGTATRSPIAPSITTQQGTVTYWDFWRDTKDADGQDALEFYIVEYDSPQSEKGGYFNIWRGPRMEPSRIEVV